MYYEQLLSDIDIASIDIDMYIFIDATCSVVIDKLNAKLAHIV